MNDSHRRLLSFQQAAPTAISRLRERYGRPIMEGGQYEFHSPLAPVFVCTRITPVLEPRQDIPPGSCHVKLVATVDVIIAPDRPTMELTLVGIPVSNNGGQPDTPPLTPSDEPPDEPSQPS